MEVPAARRNLRFVVQKHAARRLHYDLRLEVDGVLKSWPVPMGPSYNPEDKRLAVMMVEDHPLDYATFEGVIPKGSYGAGEMIVWGNGVYSPDEGWLSFGAPEEVQERMRAGIEAGKLSFTLRGHKLRGSWTLVRIASSEKDWLLIKHKDEHADEDRDVTQEERSVRSGLTIPDLKAGLLPDPSRDGLGMAQTLGEKAPFPSDLKPMLARLVDEAFSAPGWLFEPKLDGFRALAFVRQGQVTLRSRNGNEFTSSFPMVATDLEIQAVEEMVLDGEIVALDERGLPSFSLMQRATDPTDKGGPEIESSPGPIIYYPFDLLYADGVSLQRLPLSQRKVLLERVVLPGNSVQPMEYVEEQGETFFKGAVVMGLEGMVAKRVDSIYEPGARSRGWLKVKDVDSDEFVVGGYTQGEGGRASSFGSLLLGQYSDGDLVFSGRAGSGFNDAVLRDIRGRLDHLAVDQSPFVEDPELDTIEARWVRPELVAQVKFNERTNDNRLRGPVFMGLRADLDHRFVRREVADASVDVPSSGEATSSSGSVAEVLEQLSGTLQAATVEIGSHQISVTNLDKVFWPAEDGIPQFTKGDMIRYYVAMAPVILPHLKDRPLTLTRYPNGIRGQSFYQKHFEYEIPEFVETVRLYTSDTEGDDDYVVVNNLATLLWLAQLADLELHPWLSRTAQQPDATHLPTTFAGSKEAIRGSVLGYPDFIVFDLDPYIYSGKEKAGDEPELNRKAFAKTGEVAQTLKEVLDELSLSSFLKTSGKTGLHIYVPVLRQYDYATTRKTCELVGRFLLQQRPREVTMEWTVSKRSGKIFLDHNQNVQGKNMASIYSLRPLPGAPVSTPLKWDELGEVYPTDFTIETVPKRVDALGDLWANVLSAKHDLKRLLEGGL